ncbi:unnamed protein product [Diabrotica balteata]|uniref:CDAN1-interacting nuclease 1 n=1 Tax=Diabrotica balteata TaxID=107213 RepID=A0A9N9TA05_DIABA|nr:unnamed protein product [Diabrotica balteata]
MNVEDYNNIVSFIRNYKGLTIYCMKELVEKFSSCSYDTLYSILQFEYQKRMKINHSRTQHNKQRFWELYQQSVKNKEDPGIIVRIAENFDIGPCLVAKIILNKYFENNNDENAEPVSNVNVYLRDTSLISDPILAYEMFLCTLYDNVYSPLTDAMKSSLGQQYEIKLYREATQLGLGFRDEEQLRRYGYDKTPDLMSSSSESEDEIIRKQRKGVVNAGNYKQNFIRNAKVKGKAHINHVGKEVLQRKTGVNCGCLKKCCHMFSCENKEEIIANINQLSNKNEQDLYLHRLIDSNPVQNIRNHLDLV